MLIRMGRRAKSACWAQRPDMQGVRLILSPGAAGVLRGYFYPYFGC